MGRWLVHYLSDQGHKIIISDNRRDEAASVAEATGATLAKTNREAAQKAEIVFLATPMDVTPKITRNISSEIGRDTSIVEISSLKSQIIPVLENIAKKGVRTASIHPLFGPGVQDITKEKIALVPVSDPSLEYELVKTLFPGVEIVVVDAEEHDKAMAMTLSLPHFLNIAFASVVGEEDINMLKKLGGTTFALQLVLSEGVMTEDPMLYALIQTSNEYTLHYLERFLSKAEALKQHISRKDPQKFLQFYADIRSSLLKDADFADAYKRMYEALEACKSSSQ
jgi:prephenate dehydrogenase